MVFKRAFTSTRTHFWWPRRKDEEVGRDAALDEENADNIHDSLTKDKTLRPNDLQPRRHEVPKRIHILGIGNLGAFVAHSLAGIPDRPPITLLLHRRQLRVWEDYDCSIEIITRGLKESRRGFEAEAVRRLSENFPFSVENRFRNEDSLTSKTEIGEPEFSSASDLTSKTGDTLLVNAPILQESNPGADDSTQQDRAGYGIALEESILKADEPSMLQTEINDWFAQAELEVDASQHYD